MMTACNVAGSFRLRGYGQWQTLSDTETVHKNEEDGICPVLLVNCIESPSTFPARC